MHETGEMQGLESPDIGGRDGDDTSRVPNPILKPLLFLNTIDDGVRCHDLRGIRMRPWSDPDPVPPDDDPASGNCGVVGGG